MFDIFDATGNHELAAPNLLAHEFGHLLGSDHDFDIPRYNVHSKCVY